MKARKTRSSKRKRSYAVDNQHYLTLLSKCKQKNRRNKLIEAASSNEIRAISECIKNIVEGNVPIDNKQLQILKRYKQVLRSLAQRCFSIKKKRMLLRQRGGFLGAILPIALGALSSIVGPLFGAK